MTQDLNEPASAQDRPQSTVPVGFQVTALDLEGEEADAISQQLTRLVTDMGRLIDLTHLDGVTFAMDYPQALRTLDRGHAGLRPLTPSGGRVLSLAMTPTVLRDGHLKSHIVVNASVFFGMLKANEGMRALHLLAHECAHVEANAQFDGVFPDILLRQQKSNIRDATRWEIILACWDEYAACKRSARFGDNPASEYEVTLLTHLADARERANDFIKNYRLHGQHGQITQEVTQVYGDLMKFSAYLLGTLVGLGQSWTECEPVVATLDEHWFSPYFEQLDRALSDLDAQAGKWPDQGGFEAIGDLAEEVLADGGMTFVESDTHPGECGISIPLTPATVPY